MPDFMSMRMSSPSAFQATAGSTLASSAQALLATLQAFNKTNDMTGVWSGSSTQGHQNRTSKLVDLVGRVIQAIGTAGTTATTGGAQMQVLKAFNDATVASAQAGQFVVMPTGQVVPGPSHYAQASGPHYAAIMAAFWSIANMFTGQINGTVAKSTMTDTQTAMALAGIAMQYFADLMNNDSGAATTGITPTPGATTPPPAFDIGDYDTTRPDPIMPPDMDLGPGTGLAGVTPIPGSGGMGGSGPLGGAGGVGGFGGLGGAGTIGGVGGTTGLGGAAGMAGPAMAGMYGAAGAGQPGAGASGAAARGGMAGGAMMPLGGAYGAGARGEENERGSETWLHEDRDPFDPDDDAPESVLT